MVKKISFIHAADLHLDSPFKGLAHMPEVIFKEIQESSFTALENLVLTAIHRNVDFVLLTGDLFDNEKQSLKAQVRLRQAFEQLNRHHIHVYLSYGNHDYINGNIHPITYPNNVFIFPGEKVTSFTYEKEGQAIANIYGFSYENRSVKENKTEEYKVKDKHVPFHIAMLHGSIKSNKDHDVYAPFQISDLIKDNFDYWALGHIHTREVLKENPYIVYSGNTQGRHRNETGEKGCYHVVLSELKSEVSFVPLHAIEFSTLQVDVSECDEIHQIETMIQVALKREKVTTPQLIDITLQSENTNITNWKREGYIDEVIELANETLIHQQHWNYIIRYTTETRQITDYIKEYAKGDHFVGELVRQFKEESIQKHVTELYNHRQGRKHLEQLTKEEELLIKAESEQLLIHGLIDRGGE